MKPSPKHDAHCDCGVCAYCDGQEDIWGNKKSDMAIRRAQPQGGERHRFRRGGRVYDQMCGQCNAVADAPIHQMGDIERAAAADLPRATAEADRWDKSGLKEACQRGIAMGRTRQEFDLQLLLDMLLEIERLETAPRATGETTVEAALAELRELFGDGNTLIQRNDTFAFTNPSLNNWVMIFRYEQFIQKKFGEGATLDEAMAQVRAAAQAKTENEEK